MPTPYKHFSQHSFISESFRSVTLFCHPAHKWSYRSDQSRTENQRPVDKQSPGSSVKPPKPTTCDWTYIIVEDTETDLAIAAG